MTPHAVFRPCGATIHSATEPVANFFPNRYHGVVPRLSSPSLSASLGGWPVIPRRATRVHSMIRIFHGTDAKTHQEFQAWRQAHVDGYHMTENAKGRFTIHYAQDKRENASGRGCMHQGCSFQKYLADKNGCYTKARKVCSVNFHELIEWATEQGFTVKNCSHCDSKRFPFPLLLVQPFRLPEEEAIMGALFEGSVCQVKINAYERNAIARERCIAHYGSSCVVCGLNFGAVYGTLAEGFIHVHHVTPLSAIDDEYEVDPISDLRPVCPNCHAVIHLDGKCRRIEEVKRLLKR
ncbi:MAG: HNH endonuclease [Planctomycetes bacterium]|nr:HNH endonuclease [Planctomycetota bacterium]